MNALDVAERALRKHLAEHPQVTLARTDAALTIGGSSGGFDVVLTEDGREVTVAGGGWHDHYEVPEEAADMAMWLLSARARVVAAAWGDAEFAWTFEILDEGSWRTVSTMGIGLPRPFWRRRRKIVRQNRLIE